MGQKENCSAISQNNHINRTKEVGNSSLHKAQSILAGITYMDEIIKNNRNKVLMDVDRIERIIATLMCVADHVVSVDSDSSVDGKTGLNYVITACAEDLSQIVGTERRRESA